VAQSWSINFDIIHRLRNTSLSVSAIFMSYTINWNETIWTKLKNAFFKLVMKLR